MNLRSFGGREVGREDAQSESKRVSGGCSGHGIEKLYGWNAVKRQPFEYRIDECGSVQAVPFSGGGKFPLPPLGEPPPDTAPGAGGAAGEEYGVAVFVKKRRAGERIGGGAGEVLIKGGNGGGGIGDKAAVFLGKYERRVGKSGGEELAFQCEGAAGAELAQG